MKKIKNQKKQKPSVKSKTTSKDKLKKLNKNQISEPQKKYKDKNKKKPLLISFVIFLILIVTCSGLLVFYAEKAAALWAEWFPLSDETVQNSANYGMDGQSNGNLTLDQIENLLADDDRPNFNDIVRNFYVVELPNYVVIFRKSQQTNGTYKYPNLLFIKTANGLVWDGALGVSTVVPLETKKILGITTKTGRHNFNSAVTTLNFNNDISALNNTNWADKIGLFATFGVAMLFNTALVDASQDYVTFSDFKTYFAKDFNNMGIIAYLKYHIDEEKKLFNYIQDFLYKNVVKLYFEQLTDLLTDCSVELKNGGGQTTAEKYKNNQEKLNSVATWLWTQSKTTSHAENDVIVDLNNYFINVIPESLQPNYPITNEELKQSTGLENYVLYDCDIVAHVSYKYKEASLYREPSTALKEASIYFVEPLPQNAKNYTLVNVVLNNPEESSLSNFNIETEPVTIAFGAKKIIFDTISGFAGSQIALESSIPITWTIQSTGLIFNSLNGSLTPIGKTSTLTFDFYYYNESVPVTVNLNNLSSVSLDLIDLVENPVRIVFTNSNHTYQFIFDNNQKLTKSITILIEKGDYDYTILSNQLIFATNSGSYTISSESRNFTFNYAVNTGTNYSIGLTETNLVRASIQYGLYLNIISIYQLFGYYVENIDLKVTIYNSNFTQIYFNDYLTFNKNSLFANDAESNKLFSSGDVLDQVLRSHESDELKLIIGYNDGGALSQSNSITFYPSSLQKLLNLTIQEL